MVHRRTGNEQPVPEFLAGMYSNESGTTTVATFGDVSACNAIQIVVQHMHTALSQWCSNT